MLSGHQCPLLSPEGNVLLLLWPRWSSLCLADKNCSSGFRGLLFWFSYLSCQVVPVLGQFFPVSTPSCSSILAHLPFFCVDYCNGPLILSIHSWCNSPLPDPSLPCYSPDQNLESKIPLSAYKKWHFLGPALSFQPHFNPSGLLCSIRTSKSLQESGSLLTQDLSPLSLHPLVLSLKSVPHGQLPTLSRMSYRLLLH